MISYDRYVSMLSENIRGKASKEDLKAIKEFEKSQPKQCPKCDAQTISPFEPKRIIHDISKCKPK